MMVSICDELLSLTRGYLEFAGLVDGSRSPCMGTFSLGAIVREFERQAGPMIMAKGLEWEIVSNPADAVVTTDASRCQQIFTNLLSNAIKFTPRGGKVRIEVIAASQWWSVIVEDNGPGIPSESRERVFEPFFRLARDEHSRAPGNGLGLAVCRELVDQLRGEILLDSVPGCGTRVTVRLPVEPPSKALPSLERQIGADCERLTIARGGCKAEKIL